MSSMSNLRAKVFGQTVAADPGQAVVRNWYQEGETSQGRGFRGYKVTRMKLVPFIDDEEVLAFFGWESDYTMPHTIMLDLDPSLERAAAFAADWNAGGARRERALRSATAAPWDGWTHRWRSTRPTSSTGARVLSG